MPDNSGKAETRDCYPHSLTLATRWRDIDVFGHVNNAVYYEYFDSIINRYLMETGGNDPVQDDCMQFCVENRCQYHRELSFPQQVDARLRVAKLGNSSVRYELALFTEGEDTPAATGYFVHVFVNRASREATPIPPDIRAALSELVVDDGSD